MQFDILTLFPEQMEAIFAHSILKRAQTEAKIAINIHDLRRYTSDPRKTVDDRPFGGGPGMLMMVEPIYLALKDLGVYPKRDLKTKVFLTSAAGATWNQTQAQQAASDLGRIILICGHYEGVDHRVTQHLVDEEVSIGNYVLTGGELAAGVIVDSIARLIPGVLGNEASLSEESHSEAFSAAQAGQTTGEYPQFTRPAEFETAEGEKWTVPDVLLSGNHAQIANWRRENLKA